MSADPIAVHHVDSQCRQFCTTVGRAKINLFLHVLGRRLDGLHQLQSLVCFANIGDRLTLRVNEPLGLTIDGPFSIDISARHNLILDAAYRYADMLCGDAVLGSFCLIKFLPVASGIGGGSADAAAALRLLDEANGGRMMDRLHDVAIGVGADVPVCLASRSSLVGGCGEDITPVRMAAPLYAILVNAGVNLLTRHVFEALDGRMSGKSVDILPDVFMSSDGMIDFLRTVRNDLEVPARELFPVVGQCLDAVRATTGCLLARMSGSGATVFGLYREQKTAEAAISSLQLHHPDWWMRSVILGDEDMFGEVSEVY